MSLSGRRTLARFGVAAAPSNPLPSAPRPGTEIPRRDGPSRPSIHGGFRKAVRWYGKQMLVVPASSLGKAKLVKPFSHALEDAVGHCAGQLSSPPEPGCPASILGIGPG